MSKDKLQPHELPYMRDGKLEMVRNANPLKYHVIRSRVDGSVKYASKNVNDKTLAEWREKATKKKPTALYVAEWYKDDATAEAELGFKFSPDEVDKKTN